MASTVKARPTHYETLGLTPAASEAEIARAFAREIGRPRAFGGIAEVSIAYETLRNAGRRAAYDRSIGLGPEPESEKPAEPSSLWSGAPYMLRAAAHPAETPALVERPKPAPSDEGRAFIAARLEQLARPEPLREPAVQAPEPVAPRPAAEPEMPVAYEPDEETVEAAPQWQRTAFAGGGLVLAVAVIGAWAGWQSTADMPQPAKVTALLTPPTTFTVADAKASAPAPGAALDQARAVQPQRPKRAIAARAAATKRPSRLAGIEQQLSAPAETAASEVEPPAVESSPAKAVAASLPLSNAVIAQTIGRIGYPCGKVAGTSAGDTLGTFTVTCSSGDSYRAAPVRGRYRFRKLR